MRIAIRPEWLLTPSDSKPDSKPFSLPVLLQLLALIESHGSIIEAARDMNLSYRNAWGLLRDFDRQFGAPLVVKSRGQGSKLSSLAEKLLWADKRIAARLSPTLDSLASELEAELEGVLSTPRQALRISASHGFAVAALVAALGEAGTPVDLAYRNSTEAVAALARGECDLAGFHVPEGEFEAASMKQYRKWLKPRQHVLVHLASRAQGLFVAAGNPHGIVGVADLKRPDLRFVNRQIGSGTRMLLELFLAREKIRFDQIRGYDSAEYTHAAVAAYIASGMADVGFGVEHAARRFGLDFIPIVRERYFFACQTRLLKQPLLQSVITLLKTDLLRRQINQLAGYDSQHSGLVQTLSEAFGG